MATAREHADAYLAQAKEDLAAATALAPSGVAPSVLAMLLQMSFEKLAKAALLRNRTLTVDDAKRSHRAASALVLQLQRNNALVPLGGAAVWRDVLAVVPELERAQPQIAAPNNGARLEYPWEDAEGRIRWPARDLVIAQSIVDPARNRATRILAFASQLVRHFDEIFP